MTVSRIWAAVCCLVSVIVVANCHLCLVSPPQRGQLGDLNKKGADGCFQVKGPCGSLPAPEYPRTLYLVKHGNSFNISVVFQKNLDHFNSKNPGYFSISIAQKETANGLKTDFKELARVQDTSIPSLHIYDVVVQIPTQIQKQYILQASYVTNNPAAPAAFYQCADFGVIEI